MLSSGLGVSSPHFTTLCVGCKTRQTLRLFFGVSMEVFFQEDTKIGLMINLALGWPCHLQRICEECDRIPVTPKLGFGLGIS